MSNQLESDLTQRLEWNVGSNVLVYCESKKAFVFGTICESYVDDNGEWLKVQTNGEKKTVQRYSKDIKPCSNDDESKSEEEEHILKMIETNKGELFENVENQKDEKACIERIKFILKIHSKWIENNRKNKHLICNQNIDIRDIINDKLSKTYNYYSFLSDFRFISNLNKDILNENEEKNVCSAAECIIMDRNERDRAYFKHNELQRMVLYFVASNDSNKNELDNDMINKTICTQQILDALHSLIYHTVYVDIGDIEAQFANKDINNVDLDKLCDDFNAQRICDLIESKRKSSSRYRERRTNTHNKFKTVSSFKGNALNKVNENDNPQCFVDVLLIGMKKNEIQQKEFDKIDEFIYNQEYDTESIIFDVEDMNNNGFFKSLLNVSIKFQEFTNKLIKERRIGQMVYSGGKRYFYWQFYKDNVNIRNVLFRHPTTGQPFYEENIGYKLCEWFIAAKYSNLKEELLNNLICIFSIKQFETTINKANDKLRSWIHDKHIQNIRCKRSYWSKTYGIKYGDEITLQHIMSVMFYTNYSSECYEFSKTFRKISEYESDESMKKRHQEFAIWGRLLRETVECFGNAMERSSIKTFYHGISESLVFESTMVYFYGPVSTTSDFQVASGTFSRGGLVLSLDGGDVFHPFFDCPYWSDYAAERERLFIGGLQPFYFITIRNMDSQPVKNYYHYVNVIRMFAMMIGGFVWLDGKIKKGSLSTLKVLIKEEIEQKAIKGIPSEVSPYILNLWHYVLLKIKQITINWGLINAQLFYNKPHHKRFGYKAISSLFLCSDSTSLDFSVFLNILPNLERIDLIHFYNDGNICEWRQTVSLNETFKTELVKGILSHNNSSPLCSIHIVNPSSDITAFINQNNNEFNEYQWNLEKQTYQYKYSKENCNNCLSIEKF